MEWLGVALHMARLLMARLAGKDPALIKAAPFSKVEVNITVGDIAINETRAQLNALLDPEAVVARHLFLKKKLIVGTKAGRMEIYLPSGVYDQQVAAAESVLVALHKNGVLAPLDNT